MAAGPYRPVSFAEEPLTDEKMNQLANNVQWVYENSPRAMYNAHGVVKSNGVKILAGKTWMPASTSTLSYATVYFGSFFSQGCLPVVVATPTQHYGQTRYETVVRGLGQAFPDNRGCQIGITTDEYNAVNNHHAHGLTANWIAIGW